MDLRQQLLDQIQAYLARTGMTAWSLGEAAIGDGKLVSRLREGKATLRTIERVQQFMASNPRSPAPASQDAA